MLCVADILCYIIPVLSLLNLLCQRTHNESLLLCGTYINTVVTACTVHRRYLDAELESLSLAQALLPLEARCCSLLLSSEEGADSSVRTYICTLVTLDTVLNLPLGNACSDATLLVCSGAVIPSTILAAVECRYGEHITLERVDRLTYLAYECGDSLVNYSLSLLALDVCPLCGNLNLNYSLATCVNSGVVHIHDILTLLAVRLVNRLLHLLDSLLDRNDVGNLEEC